MQKKLVAFLLVLLVLGQVTVKPVFSHEEGESEEDHDHSFYELAIGQGSSDDNEDEKEDLEKRIGDLEKKIAKIQSKEKSLQNEIDSINDQVNLVQLKIRQSEADIRKKENELQDLAGNISDVSGKIGNLKDKVSYQYLIFSQRMRSRYKTGVVTPFDYIFSDNINNMVQKLKFIESIETEDNKVIERLKETKQNYEWQKTTLEDKKTKAENLKTKIEADKIKLLDYKQDLSNDKAKKDALLQQTQGDEAKYQDQLNKAKAELDAIEGAVSSVNFASGSKVDKGEVIAVMGNSGAPSCSTGAHLHFEVRKNGKAVNSEGYLKSTRLYVNDFSSGYKNIGSGSWAWPMKSPEITQRYGRTPWSWRYSGNSHTGVDMVASNTYIYAPDDGKLTKGTISCYGSPMNYVAIDHGSGIVSYYFHVR